MMQFSIRYLLENLRLREKILVISLTLSIFPLIVISVLNYNVTVSHTYETMTDFSNLFALQLCSEIESYIFEIDNISKSIIYDQSTLDFLLNEEEYILMERVSNRRIIDNYLYNMSLQKPDVKEIYIIGSSNYVYYRGDLNTIPPDINDVKNLPWFQKISDSNGRLIITPEGTGADESTVGDRENFTIGRILRDANRKTCGMIAYHVKLENIIRTNEKWEQIIQEYDIGIEVHNALGEIIYHIPSEVLAGIDERERNREAIAISNTSSNYGLSILILVPRQTLFHRIDMLKRIDIFCVLLMVLITFLLTFFLSHHITKPLSDLSKGMQFVQEQRYNHILPTSRNDEIGVLTNTYNQMILKINTLINEVYITKLNERKAQLVALQNQINPHMLFNTIENIRMRATLNNDPEVSDMIKDLGKIFRLTLAKGKKNHTIDDEMEYIRTYIRLLNIRHENRFQLKIHLTDKILELGVIRFLFQPIVENCVMHGFRDREESCEIDIDGEVSENWIRIFVRDNGNGIAPERLSEIKQILFSSCGLNEMEGGIGLPNVYYRIKLEYGEEYYLDIHSAGSMQGTVVEMLLPARRNSKKPEG